ncbi:MAG: hypothetical protein DRH57_00305 [Candidatus Cloacimonadota bacterium]|nr:MAG: hypothetical protein DRH57_00305 [Candidatus Cloacimonadota bacterium]
MVKKILQGDVWHKYVGLAQHLFNKLPAGQKKVYRVGDAVIEVCKKNPSDYIRIRVSEERGKDVAIFATFQWDFAGDEDHFKLDLAFWKIDSAGNIDTIWADQFDWYNGYINEPLCGRFGVINPLSFYLYFYDNLSHTTTDKENVRVCYDRWGNEKRVFCDREHSSYTRAYVYRFDLDYKKLSFSAKKIKTYTDSSYYEWQWMHPYCEQYDPNDWHWDDWLNAWSYAKLGNRIFEKKWKSVLDIYPLGDDIKELYLEHHSKVQYFDINDVPYNPEGQASEYCPASRYTHYPRYTQLEEAYKRDPRARASVHNSLKYNGHSITLENTKVHCCMRFYYTGLYYERDIPCFGGRDVSKNPINAFIVNESDFVWCYYEKRDMNHFYVDCIRKSLGSYDIPQELYGPYTYVSCYDPYQPDGFLGAGVPYCHVAQHHGYVKRVTFPALSLLTRNRMVFTANLRIIREFSYADNVFDVVPLDEISFFTDKHGNDALIFDRMVLMYPDPAFEKSDQERYKGFLIVDDADYSYCGLGFSNPIFFKGPYFLPFVQFKIEDDTIFYKPKKKEHFGQSLLNPTYWDCIIFPRIPDAGFFIGKQGAPPGLKSVLLGERVLLDVQYLQKYKDKWYKNGDELEDFNEKLLG